MSQFDPMSSVHHEFFKRTQIKEICDWQKPRDLVTIDERTGIHATFQLLADNHIQAVIVTRNDRPFAIVSTFDLVVYCVFQPLFELENIETHLPSTLAANAEYLNHTAKDVIQRKPDACNLHTVRASDPLSKLVTMFAHGTYRVIVENGVGKLKLISQSDFIGFIFDHKEELGKVLDTFASELSSIALKQTKKYSNIHDHPDLINISQSAICAFKKMVGHGVSALAVVDDTGVLVTKISTTDVTGLNEKHIEAAVRPVNIYLREVHNNNLPEVHIISPKWTLLQIITRMAQLKCHRVFMVDDENKPVGIVSISDICQALERKSNEVMHMQPHAVREKGGENVHLQSAAIREKEF